MLCPSASPGASASTGPSAVKPASTATSFCYLVSRAQVSAALGHVIGPGSASAIGECTYKLTGGTGDVAIMVWKFPDGAKARYFYNTTTAQLKIQAKAAIIPGLGQQAMAATEPAKAAAAALTGSEVITTVVEWQSAAARMAVTLVRDAYNRL